MTLNVLFRVQKMIIVIQEGENKINRLPCFDGTVIETRTAVILS